MINTHQTSVFPPTVPPRLSQRTPASAAPRRGPGRAALRVLVGVVVFHLLLSLGGFYYLYTGRMVTITLSPRVSAERHPEECHPAMASMIVKPLPHRATDTTTEPQYLQWNMAHSKRCRVDYYQASWLKMKQAGYYYVYARVSFSRGGAPGQPLVSKVMLKHDETREPEDKMKAYCSLGNRSIGQCTASQGQLLHLEVGNLLSVWVENATWVDYEKHATTFGMYKL
ncbi:hypothetical protein NHX12_011469 [Muraenolepis orangiensis]|uniref:THD domain-containing protein n=1 Tax=Muraenolepis orangiensis TaxID=630683 RepID=A0A9Q0I6Q4_9TELE|nr:hypothetical protein NHX12_011469 [Muraenolepis orangiensis]